MLDLFDRRNRKHEKHFVHHNTRRSWEDMRQKLSKRKTLIVDAVVSGGAGTDRQIMERVMLSEPNMVRPSITRLVQMGMLVEVGSTTCGITNKRVRLVDLPKNE